MHYAIKGAPDLGFGTSLGKKVKGEGRDGWVGVEGVTRSIHSGNHWKTRMSYDFGVFSCAEKSAKLLLDDECLYLMA